MRRLILASLAVAALASCSKESEVDTAVTAALSQIPIEFSTYTSSAATKGNPIDSNAEFSGATNSFEVIAYLDSDGDGNAQYTAAPAKYFDWSTVTYNGSSWANTDAMYWPNYDATIYFAAIYDNLALTSSTDNVLTSYDFTVAAGVSESYLNTPSLTFTYTVPGERGNTVSKTSADQKDILYAITSETYEAPEITSGTTNTDPTVNLNFKHALSQIGFTATKDADITVAVSSVTICNVMSSGTFTASTVTDNSVAADSNGNVLSANVDTDDFGSWGSLATQAHYDATLVSTSVTVAAGETATTLTNATATTMDSGASTNSSYEATAALILMPQSLTAWSPATPTGDSDTTGTASVSGTNSYLAIKCTVYHNNSTTPIIDGYVYVPFGTSGLTTNDAWAPGYKYTYNLHFGGGYTDSTPNDTDTDPIPDPGTEPDPDDLVETLRAITYTVTVDEWIPVAGGTISL